MGEWRASVFFPWGKFKTSASHLLVIRHKDKLRTYFDAINLSAVSGAPSSARRYIKKTETSYRNGRSNNVLLKFGFTQEGTLRQRHFFRGAYEDQLYFGLLKAEWPQRTAP